MIHIKIPAQRTLKERYEIVEINGKKIRVINYIGTNDPTVIILEGEEVESSKEKGDK